MRWFMGAEVTTVSAFSRTLIPEIVVEDTTMALLEFSNGAICSLFQVALFLLQPSLARSTGLESWAQMV